MDNRLKIKERERKNKYLDTARKQRKQWKIKETVIEVVIVRLVKRLEKL